MLRKYTFQLTQYTYNSRSFNRNFSNMWGPSNVLIYRDAYKVEFLTSSIGLLLAHRLSLRIISGCLKNIMNFDLEELSFNILLLPPLS